jgi:hypothetical protein
VIRDEQHWKFENYRQRITRKQWQEILLNEDDTVIFHGRVRKLKAKSLGAGVYEIYKEGLKDD